MVNFFMVEGVPMDAVVASDRSLLVEFRDSKFSRKCLRIRTRGFEFATGLGEVEVREGSVGIKVRFRVGAVRKVRGMVRQLGAQPPWR